MMVLPGQEIHQLIAGASQLATSALAAALWQGLLLAGAAAIGLRLLPETPAPVRFSIWFGVFLLVGGLPFATVWMGHAGAAAATVGSHHAWLTLDARWCVWVAALWAAMSLIRAITLIGAAVRVRALWKRAKPIELALPEMERKAQVCVSDEVDRPTVIGFFSPKIVIPEWLIAKLTPAELEQVVLHEAGHLSRRDDWLNLLQKLALLIFPLNPALAWVERRLCFERELACDERVLDATGAPKAYAECLASLAEYRLQRRGLVRGLVLALGALGRESELTQRVLRILSGGTRMKRSHARLVLGGATASLVFAATALERSPQIVSFTNVVSPAIRLAQQTETASTSHDAGFRVVAVRASVAPAQQWKSIGDAPARIAHKAEPKSLVATQKSLAPKSFVPKMVAPQQPDAMVADGATAQDVSTMNTRAARAPQIVQTVATMTRQMTANGEVVLTRWVSVTAVNVSAWNTSPRDDNRSDGSTQPAQGAPQQSAPGQQHQQVRPYAAVPVQGGWLVFQL
jgi:beta-lactamase regulating signal transducer with metallopeptidase domain